MTRCLIDTGPMVALFDASDQYHSRAVDFIRSYNGQLLSSLANITETVYLLDFSQQAQTDFLSWVAHGAVQIEPIDASDVQKIVKVFQKYADLPMDFADGCLVAIAQKLNISHIATFDSDFEIYRLKGGKRFDIVV